MAWFFTILTYLFFWLLWPFLLTHPKLRRGVRARLGFYPPGWLRLASGPRIWFHGASAGDILALLPTVRALKARLPAAHIIASTTTNSGRAILENHAGMWAGITYLPYDLPGAVRRALKAIQPDVLVLEYTELWPHLIRMAHQRGVRLVLHNGRFNPNHLRRYRLLFALAGNLLHRMSLLLLRHEREAESALALEAPSDRIKVTGNTKFDRVHQTPDPAQVLALRTAMGFAPDALVWIMGSTHEGEEKRLLRVFVAAREHYPQLCAIIAPRYVERAEKIAALAERFGLRARLRSHATAATTRPLPPASLVVLDTMGELLACYCLADIVFVGGSFCKRGGQNILEPAACGKPVLFGPNMRNFPDAVQTLLGRGGIQVATTRQLRRVVLDLLGQPTYRQELGALARQQVCNGHGAAARNAALIATLLPLHRAAAPQAPTLSQPTATL